MAYAKIVTQGLGKDKERSGQLLRGNVCGEGGGAFRGGRGY